MLKCQYVRLSVPLLENQKVVLLERCYVSYFVELMVCWTFGLPGKLYLVVWTVGLLVHWTLGILGYWTVGMLDHVMVCWTVGMHWTIGMLSCRYVDLLNCRLVKLLKCCPNHLLELWYARQL